MESKRSIKILLQINIRHHKMNEIKLLNPRKKEQKEKIEIEV
jgi:hypothetical protein